MCEYERAQHISRPLFKEKTARAPEEEASHNGYGVVGEGGAQEPLALGRPAPGWAPGAPLRLGASSTVKFFENMVHGQKFARKDIHIIFPKGLKTQKIFSKKGKVLEKIPACRKQF